MTNRPLLEKTVEVDSIPAGGLSFHIEPTQAERQQIAGAYGLPEVRRLAADLDIAREANRTIVVDGRVAAEVVQDCVVSLVPVVQAIDEPILVRYAEGAAQPSARPGAEVRVDPDADEPEVLTGRTIDLGALVLEHFALAIDPYPRAPGAVLPEADAPPSGDAGSPFAILARLAKND